MEQPDILDHRMGTFLAVCQEGTCSGAAEHLHMTQPGVSQQVAALERTWGCRLFERRGRRMVLTPPGEILRDFARGVRNDAMRTRERMDARGRVVPLRLGATRTIGEYVLPPLLAPWLAENPGVDLTLEVDNTARLLAGLESGELDGAWIEGVFDGGGFETRELARDALVGVCAPCHPLAGKEVTLDDLGGERLLVREKGSGGRLVLERALEARNRGPGHFGSLVELGNIEALKSLTAAGTGICFLYLASVRDDLARGRLARLCIADWQVEHSYTFVMPLDARYPREVRAVQEAFAALYPGEVPGGTGPQAR